jgi:hypothetical protein
VACKRRASYKTGAAAPARNAHSGARRTYISRCPQFESVAWLLVTSRPPPIPHTVFFRTWVVPWLLHVHFFGSAPIVWAYAAAAAAGPSRPASRRWRTAAIARRGKMCRKKWASGWLDLAVASLHTPTLWLGWPLSRHCGPCRGAGRARACRHPSRSTATHTLRAKGSWVPIDKVLVQSSVQGRERRGERGARAFDIPRLCVGGSWLAQSSPGSARTLARARLLGCHHGNTVCLEQAQQRARTRVICFFWWAALCLRTNGQWCIRLAQHTRRHWRFQTGVCPLNGVVAANQHHVPVDSSGSPLQRAAAAHTRCNGCGSPNGGPPPRTRQSAMSLKARFVRPTWPQRTTTYDFYTRARAFHGAPGGSLGLHGSCFSLSLSLSTHRNVRSAQCAVRSATDPRVCVVSSV